MPFPSQSSAQTRAFAAARCNSPSPTKRTPSRSSRETRNSRKSDAASAAGGGAASAIKLEPLDPNAIALAPPARLKTIPRTQLVVAPLEFDLDDVYASCAEDVGVLALPPYAEPYDAEFVDLRHHNYPDICNGVRQLFNAYVPLIPALEEDEEDWEDDDDDEDAPEDDVLLVVNDCCRFCLRWKRGVCKGMLGEVVGSLVGRLLAGKFIPIAIEARDMVEDPEGSIPVYRAKHPEDAPFIAKAIANSLVDRDRPHARFAEPLTARVHAQRGRTSVAMYCNPFVEWSEHGGDGMRVEHWLVLQECKRRQEVVQALRKTRKKALRTRKPLAAKKRKATEVLERKKGVKEEKKE